MDQYLKLGSKENRVDFKKIWYSSYSKEEKIIRNEIIERENPSLIAIFDISRELDEGGRHAKMREIRNALTHRFLDITHLEVDDANTISKKEFFERTLNLARLVRSSLIYLIHFVDMEEQRRMNPKVKYTQKPAIEIPDEKKRV